MGAYSGIISTLLKAALFCLISYCAILLFLYLYQRHLVFKPTAQMSLPASYNGLNSVEQRTLLTNDGVHILVWYQPPPTPDAPVIIFFHGNTGNLGDRTEKIALLTKHMGVLAVSYRGFGGSEGTPSEEGLYEDARTAINYLKQQGVPESHMILYGESLGSGVVIQMATEYAPAGVVLEAGYTSLVALGQKKYPYIPVSWLMKDHFDSISKISKIKAPLLMFHGEKDPTTPAEHTRLLLGKATSPKQAIIFPEIDHTNFDLKKITDLTYDFALSAVK